jgi:hypothetical protein
MLLTTIAELSLRMLVLPVLVVVLLLDEPLLEPPDELELLLDELELLLDELELLLDELELLLDELELGTTVVDAGAESPPPPHAANNMEKHMKIQNKNGMAVYSNC